MKKLFVCMLVAAVTIGVFAQEQGKVRGGLDIGGAIPSKGGGGVALNVPLGYNLQDNMNIGIRFGIAAMAKIDPVGETGSAAVNVNFMATYAYYFNSGSAFAPFLGCGAGMYILAAADESVSQTTVEVGNRFGGLLTAGAEVGKFRLALEYNLIPSSAVTVTGSGSSTQIKNSKIPNNYLGVTIGFFIGGGKWGK